MIPHNRPTIGIEEENAALRVLRSGELAQGKEVEKFENEFCNFIDLPKGHAVALSNGTSALFLALWALDAHKKKVIFPGYVCSALRHAVNMIGATESLIDVAKDSPNIDMQILSKTNSDIAIIPHMYGLPVEITDSKIPIIEDCAQALGAKINGRSVGLQGDVGIFSFYVTKLITSGGQGGMVISKDKRLIDTIKDYREFDLRDDKKKRFNFQLTDLQAAIGREQLRKLPLFLARREQIFTKYKEAGLDLIDTDSKNRRLKPVRYRAIVKTKKPKIMIELLKSFDITAIVPTEDWELLGEKYLFPNGLQLTKETVSLPIYPSLSDESLDKILLVIKKMQ